MTSLLDGQLEEIRKKTAAVGVTPEMASAAPVSGGLLGIEPPKHWTEKAREEDGDLKFFGKMLLGGFTGMTPFLFPEMIGSRERYKSELETYQAQQEAAMMSDMVNGIDFNNLTAGDVALLNEIGMGEQGADMFTAQTAGIGGDAAIAEHFNYKPYQWSQLSPETKRDLRDRYAFENQGEGAFDYRLQAEGKAPDQLAAAEQAKAEGTGIGNEITADRQTVTGVRRQMRQIDNAIENTTEIRDLIANRQADPGKFAAGMRRIFGVETYEDGRMSATAAQGVIDQLREVSMGAISEKELQLLLGGLLDPSRSPEANLGTLDTALKRLEDNKGIAMADAKSAWGRLSNIEDQAGFLTQAEDDDWYYNNLGGGSQIQSIPAFGGNDEYTFQQYVEDTTAELGPFDQPPTRDELVIGFAKMREEAEEMYNAMIEKEKADKEAADRARLGLDRPWPTVKQ